MEFNGQNDYINLQNLSSLNILGPYTISLWVKPRSFSNYQNAIFKGDITFGQYGIVVDSTGLWVAQREHATNVNGGTMRLNEYFHLVVSADSDTIRTYQNGVFQSSDSRVQNERGSVTIGADVVNGRYFNGLIDDVRIYNRTLSPDEIRRLYNMGR